MNAKIHPDIASLARPLAELTPDPRNARRHNTDNIVQVMTSYQKHGQLKPVVVQRVADDGTLMVVRAGNGQCEAARKLGWTHVACTVVDMRDAEAIAFAIRDNRTAELAEWDGGVLADVLRDLRDDHSVALGSIGFSDADLERMTFGDGPVTDPNDEWDGMPEFDQPDATAKRRLIVNFKSDEDARAFGELIGQPLTDKTRSVWHPAVPIDHLMDKRYKSSK